MKPARRKPPTTPRAAPRPLPHEQPPEPTLEVPPDVAARLLFGVFRRDLRVASAKATESRKARRLRDGRRGPG